MGYTHPPMKTLLLILIMTMSSLAHSAQYTLREGKLHKGGVASVEVLPHDSLFIVKMDYEVFKRSWVPAPAEALKGDTVLELPTQFKDERGYLELETLGSMSIPDAELKFIRRTNLGKYHDAYEALVLPKNGKTKIEVIYHPNVPGAGWAQVRITFISNVPLLNGYQAIADLKN